MFYLPDRLVAEENLHTIDKLVLVPVGHEVEEVEQHEDDSDRDQVCLGGVVDEDGAVGQDQKDNALEEHQPEVSLLLEPDGLESDNREEEARP